ncbi:ABC transporter ATP-binding protein [Tissierella sp. Yu-01]|uniref:ABC transporter ATP-binding protein n=1 Tax=Tissierella sp. Yu-01 TaxID=3035694 RepID=UPI00240DB2A5|nr:ABC transporter ATP-binding protein [Tissierella sp. Yu-01]WFA09309.1 ABC transporter ATP-binding protein [Tissierella sp. Yu-01]
MHDTKENILFVENISKEFDTNDNRKIYALNNINFTLRKGQTLGIVGESGCGKSTLARILLQLIPPTEGRIYYKDKDMLNLKGESLRQMRRNIQAVFQDVVGSFNPKMKVKDIICAPLLNYGLIKKIQVRSKAEELLSRVELPENYADKYPFSLSGGERQRVGIARALALEPEIIICDEATSALDVTIQNKIINKLIELQKKLNISLVFISHDLALVESVCHKIIVMYCGNIVEIIEGQSLKEQAKHPYTKALIDSAFSVNMDFSKKLKCIDGEPPNNIGEIIGCTFYGRCNNHMDICRKEKPLLKEAESNHYCACHLC